MKRLTYAMVGGGKGSFIGPVHREAIRLDDLADIVAGNFSRDMESNLATAKELGLDESRVYPDWQSLIAAEKGRIDFLAICTPNDSHYPRKGAQAPLPPHGEAGAGGMEGLSLIK